MTAIGQMTFLATMVTSQNIRRRVISLAFASLVTPCAMALPSVLTQDYDMSRSGANLAETTLTPSNVSSSTFGKLFAYPVDEEVWAQPLYVPNLNIAGGTHNVVFVATMGNSVYAFDADNSSTSQSPLWSVNLGSPVPASKFFYTSVGVSHGGIYSTPVIDPSSNTMYVVTHEWSTANQTVTLYLHALGLSTGREKFGGPVQISAAGVDAGVSEQLGGLLLLNGVVYIPIGSHGDIRFNVSTLKTEPYYGMVLAYDASTLTLMASLNADARGLGGSIWQGGRGLASDGSYVYAMTANAFTPGTPDYSESFLQLNPVSLSVAGHYQDPDAACLNTLDLDLASSGPQIIPGAGTSLLVGGGKEGKVYTLQLNQALNTQTPQYFWGTSSHPTLPAEGGGCIDSRKDGYGWVQGSDTAFWNNPSGNSYYYSFGNHDQLMSWQMSGNTFTQTSGDTPPNLNPNAIALSANGGASGILWTVASQTTGLATVSAYNAVPAGGHLTLLWDTLQVPKRDALGTLGRYSVPTIANGKLYVGAGSNQVAVYGLLPTSPSVEVTAASATLNFAALGTKVDGIYVNSVAGYTGSVSLTVTGLPPGVTYSFVPASVKLTTKFATLISTLSISPAAATLALNDNYTVLIQANGGGGIISYAPLRLLLRSATFTSATKNACNSSNQMSANIAWQINGSGTPSIWIQDPTTPNFPGRLWIEPAAAKGNTTTDFEINDISHRFLYWLIDQSNGIPANFDNALSTKNLGSLYQCP